MNARLPRRPKARKPAEGASGRTASTGIGSGAYVREANHSKRWGRVVGPGPTPDEFLIQYWTGARMAAGKSEVVLFTPTEEERTLVERATRFFERSLQRAAS